MASVVALKKAVARTRGRVPTASLPALGLLGLLGIVTLAGAPRTLLATSTATPAQIAQTPQTFQVARASRLRADTINRIDLGFAPETDPDPERDRAVRLARAGRYDEALEVFWRLHRKNPNDIPLKADLVAVLSWAGLDEEALEVGADLPFDNLDPFISEAVGRSARNVGSPELAVRLYRGVVGRDETRVESQIAFTLALLETGALAEAESRLRILRERFAGHPDAVIARAHVLRAGSRYLEASSILGQLCEDVPVHPEALRLYVQSLLDLGAVSLAQEEIERAPKLFSAADRARVLARSGANAVRWAEGFAATDEALARVDSALAVVRPEDGFAYNQLRFDRIVALRGRVYMEEVLAGVRQLEEEGVELPPYVQRAAADAALYLRDAKEAVRRYRAALEGWPESREVRLGLFYALVQIDRHGEAREVIDSLLASEPRIYESPDLREPVPNPDRPEIEVASLLGRAFAADLGKAQSGLEELRELAPMNLSVRQELGSVYLWRGWPRRALNEFERILALEPDNIGARVGRATAYLNMNERGAAESTVDLLLILAPEDEHVQTVARRTDAEGLWQLSVEGGTAKSTGGALGTRDRFLNARLSAAVSSRVEFSASWRRSDAEYPDGEGVYDRIALGMQIQSRSVRLYGEASRNRQGSAEVGGAGRLDLTPGDRWSIHLRGDSHSAEVPLQAARLGIDGWRLGGGFAYRANEGTRWSVVGGTLRMSDGNDRIEAYTSLEQQLARSPRARFSALFEVYAAQNSRDDAPYYNPGQIASPAASLTWDWMPWRSYERQFVQRATVTGGAVFQEGYSGRGVFLARLEHEWDLSLQLKLRYGVEWGTPVYDDDRERRWGVNAGFGWRLF